MDYYLQDPKRLEGQPKRTIADYVEQNGIFVPCRFDSLEEARKSKKAIILRSEHTQDYEGVSGLLNSPKLSSKYSSYRGVKSLDEVKEKFFEYHERERFSSLYLQFCRLKDISLDQFKQDVSFSIWQSLGGLNRLITADSSIPNRYHLINDDPRKYHRSYVIFDNGIIETKFSWELQTDEEDVKKLVIDYEKVRNLDRFDSNNCPIMEFQTFNGRNYFLQYKRGRDFEPSTFLLDRDVEDGEIELDFVRGATIPEGIDFEMTIVGENYSRSKYMGQIPEKEDSMLQNAGFVYDRIMYPKRRFQPFYSKDLGWTFNKISARHYVMSSLFEPEVSGIVNQDYLISLDEFSRMLKEARKDGKKKVINFHLESDGRKAFLRKL